MTINAALDSAGVFLAEGDLAGAAARLARLF